MAELILALDLHSRTEALALVDRLIPTISWCKVGLELFTRYGPQLVTELRARGLRLFLDLKFYDIPHTVERAVAQAVDLGVEMLTLHCQGGQRMLEAALAAAHGRCRLFGVTVLTSFAAGELPGISKEPEAFALELAGIAAQAGLDGLVCSAQELPRLRRAYPSLHYLCPGIRPTWASAGDQRRTTTPREAVARGADFLVVGRPILTADDPLRATQLILDDMAV